ncbi:MFS transporter [Rhizobium sp. LjRoot254]|uniref:MFS transporter n=1 Tax=Rhizobium sp. LjRoot254 TaxID=3342297 RepID=UPI003ED09A59
MTDMAYSDSLDQAEPAASYSKLQVALVLFALAVGGFAIGTGEFAIMGLLPNVAATFSVSTPVAGYVISAYALGVVVGAPLIAIMAAKMARRPLLLLLMGFFAVTNILSAAAPDFTSFTILRFLSGLPHGAYFGVGALVAASMVPLHYRVRAVGKVMLGLTVATLAGTPVMAFFGQALSWEVMFWAVGLIAALTVTLIWIYLPQDRVVEGASIARELGAFTRPQVWLTLAIAATGFGGMFAIFSYIALTVTEVTLLSVGMVPVVMVIFGVGMNIGNLIGSKLADMFLMGTIGSMLVMNMVVMTMFALGAGSVWLLCLSVFLIGCGFAAGPAVQTRLMDVAADGQTMAAASMHSAFNVANAIGAWLGGVVIAMGFGYAATGWVGVVLSIIGLGIFGLSVWLERKSPTRSMRPQLPQAAE